MDFETIRVNIRENSARGSELKCIVETNSPHQPIVTLAENSFPSVQDVYAKAETVDGTVGVVIKVRFTEEIRGSGLLALNLAQPGMNGDCGYKVTPLY